MNRFFSKQCMSPVRLFFVIIIFICLYFCVFFHLFKLQVQQNQFFNSLADKQYKIKCTQTPPRAIIYDRNKQPLALNKEIYSAFITPHNLQNTEALQAFLQDYFPHTLDRLKAHHNDFFMYIKRNLSEQELSLIQQCEIADIHLLTEPGRFYTLPSLGQIIGITNIDNRGISGIELIYNTFLQGKETIYILEKDARSNHFYFTKETTAHGYEGNPITLTIDANLQFLTYEELKQYSETLEVQESAVIILNPCNGDILTIASYPDFDPNELMSEDLWLTKPRALTEVFEFGSVNKVFSALAALEEKVVTPDEIINCENREETFINGIKVTTWKACGEISFTDVIRHSNNIGTSKVALKLGKKLYHYLQKTGFSCATGINFLGEQYGFITPPNQWSKATPLSLSFGYEISATLLQLARAFSVLCNDGKLITPRIIKDESQEPLFSEQVYSSETINLMREIINLNYEGSSALQGKIPGYTIMGKTGSAYLISNGTYDKTRSLYSFVGIVEKDDYKRIIALFIREPKSTGKKVYASTVAVPLFKKIAHNMLVHDQVR